MQQPTDPARAKAAAAYNAAADHFDDEPLAFWDRYGRRTVERLSVPPGSIVLDVGSGSGASAIPAASIVGPSGRVVAVDLAERLLALARDKAERSGLRNVEFRHGDMEALGYPDGMFDAVISVFSIFFVPDMTKQVAELWRMVRPGGQLAITTWGPRMLEPGNAAWWSAVKTHAPDLHSTYAPWERITTVDAVRRLLTDAGVPVSDVVSEAGQQMLRTVDDWWSIVLGSGFRWTVDQMDQEAARRVREDNLEQLRNGGVVAVETNVIYAVARKELLE
jgi:ubiquinone/menaquinone biosynthesis C-methylase UbiE